MDWARAIEINHKVLAPFVAGLITVVGLASGGLVARLPEPVYRAVLVVLRPTESALRRLIVIAARGLKVTLPPSRPMPKGRVIAGKKKGTGSMAFQLFDTRKRFAWGLDTPDSEPGAASPSSVLHRPRPVGRPTPAADGTVDATRLSRRILALKQAFDGLPAQAKRMARWKARRKRMQNPKFTSPLRPGRPPGSRKRGKEEIDLVLKECHGLAFDALREDSS